MDPPRRGGICTEDRGGICGAAARPQFSLLNSQIYLFRRRRPSFPDSWPLEAKSPRTNDSTHQYANPPRRGWTSNLLPQFSILLFIPYKNRVEKIVFQRGFSFYLLFFRCPMVQVFQTVPDDAEDEACGEEKDPGHVGGSQGQGFHEPGQGRDGQARGLEAVV